MCFIKCRLYKAFVFRRLSYWINFTTFRHISRFLLPVGYIFLGWKFIQRITSLSLSLFNLSTSQLSIIFCHFTVVCVYVCVCIQIETALIIFWFLQEEGQETSKDPLAFNGWKHHSNSGFIVKSRVCFRLEGSFCVTELTCLKKKCKEAFKSVMKQAIKQLKRTAGNHI